MTISISFTPVRSAHYKASVCGFKVLPLELSNLYKYGYLVHSRGTECGKHVATVRLKQTNFKVMGLHQPKVSASDILLNCSDLFGKKFLGYLNEFAFYLGTVLVMLDIPVSFLLWACN